MYWSDSSAGQINKALKNALLVGILPVIRKKRWMLFFVTLKSQRQNQSHLQKNSCNLWKNIIVHTASARIACIISILEMGDWRWITLTRAYYRIFFLALSMRVRREFRIRSNRESGEGRYDVAFTGKTDTGKLHVVIVEFKAVKIEDGLENLSLIHIWRCRRRG